MNSAAASSGMTQWWNAFIDSAGAGLIALAGQRRRTIHIVEHTPGAFHVETPEADTTPLPQDLEGLEADVTLHASRFYARDIAMPAQAGDFLAQIIGNQIDRLTPWPEGVAIFGFIPGHAHEGRMDVRLVAAERSHIEAVLAPLKARGLRVHRLLAADPLGGQNVTLSSHTTTANAAPRLRRILNTALAALALLALVTTFYANWRISALDEQYENVQREMSRKRSESGMADPALSAERSAVNGKLNGPYATLVIEELSALLPDDTWLEEVDFAEDRIRIAGSSKNANGLVSVLEQSRRFSNVTFFAPTRRDASGADRFHIQAMLQTVAARGAKP